MMSIPRIVFAGIESVLRSGLISFVSFSTVVGSLLLIILMIALGWNYFKLLLEVVERYVVVGVLCYTSPLAYSMGASKDTNPVFKSWCRMVGSQLLLLVMNVWFLRAFNSSVGRYIATGGALSNGHGSIFGLPDEYSGDSLHAAYNRYLKILEIEPINFMLRSEDEQCGIISFFASWLKISPVKMQFKSLTRKADSDKHITMLRADIEKESNERCRALGEGYIQLIRDVGNREALTRRFFLIFQYEHQNMLGDDLRKVYSTLQSVEQNARAYFSLCGNSIIQPIDADEAAAEILYTFFNRRSCVEEACMRINR